MPGSGALLIAGTTSGAGKSTVTAALCRLLARRGASVAPFKAQNMSSHAAVTADGGEIGRAQAMQAAAAGVDTDRRMNPVLLKPGPGGIVHLVVDGTERQESDARSYGEIAVQLRGPVLEALESLRADHCWVVAEGAGGAAEINLLDQDLVNLPLARAAGLPAVLVIDIDRGGAFAAAYGTITILDATLRSTIHGVVFNRFRGDPSLLEPGIRDFEARTDVPVLGILPHLGTAPLLGVEDSLDLVGPAPPANSERPVRVAALQLPHLANPSDLDPLFAEPDVTVHWTLDPDLVGRADLVVIPGSRATVADLAELRRLGLDRVLAEVAAQGDAWIVGICAGHQMLGRSIHDELESGRGLVDGLGLLATDTVFASPKIVRRTEGTVDGHPVHGYEIRLGRPRSDDPPLVVTSDGPEGARRGQVLGTSLHGLFDADGFRRWFLRQVAAGRGRSFRPAETGFAATLDDQHDRLADWPGRHVDVDRLLAVGRGAAPVGAGHGW